MTIKSDSLVNRIRAEFDRLLVLQDQIGVYIAELEAMPDTGLIGPRGAAERLRSILSGVQR